LYSTVAVAPPELEELEPPLLDEPELEEELEPPPLDEPELEELELPEEEEELLDELDDDAPLDPLEELLDEPEGDTLGLPDESPPPQPDINRITPATIIEVSKRRMVTPHSHACPPSTLVRVFARTSRGGDAAGRASASD
jgi:hypothetical protein